MTDLKAPFANEDEYRSFRDLCDSKENDIDTWANHVLETELGYKAMIGDVFEGRKGALVINYWDHGTDWQHDIPIACIWSENYEELIASYKEDLHRQAVKQKREQAKQDKIDVEVGERKLLAELLEKYGP